MSSALAVPLTGILVASACALLGNFLILRRLFPSVTVLAYAAGALVIVHASDNALNWVGQLNQFGVIFWMMLALYLLVVALQQPRPITAALFTAAAALATYLCLWSYESPLFILLLAPVLLLFVFGLSRLTAAVRLPIAAQPWPSASKATGSPGT